MALSQQHLLLLSVLALLSHHTCAGCQMMWWHLGGSPPQAVWLTWSKISPLLRRGLGGKLHRVGCSCVAVTGGVCGWAGCWSPGQVGSMLSSKVQCRKLVFNLPESLSAENEFYSILPSTTCAGRFQLMVGSCSSAAMEPGEVVLPSVNPLWISRGAEM